MVPQVYYKVKVHAGARENRLLEKAPDTFEVWVKAEAERDQANAATAALLGRHLGVEPKRLRLIKGATSPSKLFTLLG